MTVVLGIDGRVDMAEKLKDYCCPADICSISEQSLACSFVSLMPSGPLWDRHKKAAFLGQSECGTIVSYAVHIGKLLYRLLSTGLWPSIRESNPNTAATTLNTWLESLGWVDCYGSCRNKSLINLSPFEINGLCGPEYCEPNYSAEYEMALKSAIARALYRLRLGIIPTIDIMNFVLEPLSARVEPEEQDELDPCAKERLCLLIKKTGNYLTVPSIDCSNIPQYIEAYLDRGCDIPAGLPSIVWPNLMAAECILRSMLPPFKSCVINTLCEEI